MNFNSLAWFISKKQKVKYFWDSIAEFFWGISLQLEMISVFFYHLVTPLFSKQLIHEFPIKAIHKTLYTAVPSAFHLRQFKDTS